MIMLSKLMMCVLFLNDHKLYIHEINIIYLIDMTLVYILIDLIENDAQQKLNFRNFSIFVVCVKESAQS